MSEQPRAEGGLGRLGELFPLDWDLVRHAGAEPVPYHLKKWWFCLGGTVLYLFIVQVGTGIALTFYYVPTPEEAYASIETITRDIRFGWYIRSLHKWSSNLMIVAVFLHLLRVFFTGAYRHPRQLNWMIGCGLLGTTLMFGFTGYSLVYEQLSYWGATVAANLAEATPLIGGVLQPDSDAGEPRQRVGGRSLRHRGGTAPPPTTRVSGSRPSSVAVSKGWKRQRRPSPSTFS